MADAVNSERRIAPLSVRQRRISLVLENCFESVSLYFHCFQSS